MFFHILKYTNRRGKECVTYWENDRSWFLFHTLPLWRALTFFGFFSETQHEK